MKLRLSLLAIFLLLGSFSLFGQNGELSRLLSRAGFTPETENSIREIFDRAEALDVPESLLLPRLQEGVAKRVPPPRIASALEKDLATLLTARSVLQSIRGGDRILSDPSRWARGANFLAAGRSEAELRTVGEACASEPESFRQATVLYISLLEWGLRRQEVAVLVEATVASDLEPEEFAGIPELFALARRERVRPSRFVERVLTALPQTDSLRELRRMVVE